VQQVPQQLPVLLLERLLLGLPGRWRLHCLRLRLLLLLLLRLQLTKQASNAPWHPLPSQPGSRLP
jgi:hypothetical protein